MTSNSIQAFDFEGQAVRTVETPDGFGLVAKDVLEYFKVSNRNRTMQQIDDDEKGGTRIDTPGGPQNLVYLTESGFYHLLFILKPTEARGLSDEELNAKIEKVEKFKRWVTHEVLPSIRNHGAYMTDAVIERTLTDPDYLIQLATQLKEQKALIASQQSQITEQAPKVLFANALETSRDSILIGQLAKLLKQNGVEIGQNRLYVWLRDHGYLSSRRGDDWNTPTQKAMGMKLFQIRTNTVIGADGRQFVNHVTLVTGKGQTYFVNKFLTKTLEAEA